MNQFGWTRDTQTLHESTLHLTSISTRNKHSRSCALIYLVEAFANTGFSFLSSFFHSLLTKSILNMWSRQGDDYTESDVDKHTMGAIKRNCTIINGTCWDHLSLPWNGTRAARQVDLPHPNVFLTLFWTTESWTLNNTKQNHVMYLNETWKVIRI